MPKNPGKTLRACTICGTPTPGPRCPEHGGNRRTLTTTKRGYGHTHQQRRASLLAQAVGTRCPLCGETMYRHQKLHLDHTTPLKDNPTSKGDRIVHARCNLQRGGGITAKTTMTHSDPASVLGRKP